MVYCGAIGGVAIHKLAFLVNLKAIIFLMLL